MKELNINKEDLIYSVKRDNLIYRDGTDAVNLYKTVKNTEQTKIDNEEVLVCLILNAMF